MLGSSSAVAESHPHPLRPGDPSGPSYLGHSLCCGHRSDPCPQSHGPYPSADHHDTDRRSDPDTLEEAGEGASGVSGAHPSTLNAQVTDTGKDVPALVTAAESQIPLGSGKTSRPFSGRETALTRLPYTIT